MIVSEVEEINTHVSAIVTAAREQSTGLQEINTAVNTMDQGTQKNAAMVEEQTAASHALASEANTLNSLLAQFSLGDVGRVVGDRRPVAKASVTPIKPAAPQAAAPAPATRIASAPAPRPVARSYAATRGNSALAVKIEDDWTEF